MRNVGRSLGQMALLTHATWSLKLEALSTHLLDMVRCQPYQSLHVHLTEFLGISAYTPSLVWVVNLS